MFSAAFVCSQDYTKSRTDFRKIRWTGDTLARKKPEDFGGNPDHITLGVVSR